MRHRSRWAWMSLLVAATTGAAEAVPVGMASYISGQPTVNGKPLRLLQRLDAGAKVHCGPGSDAVIVLFGNGSRYEVGAGQTGTVQEGGVPGAKAMAGLSGPSSRVAKALGGSRAGALLARGEQRYGKMQTVPTAAPDWMMEGDRHFQWDEIPGVATYVFTLFDQLNNVVWSTSVTETQADYPTDLPSLQLRQPYVWRVGGFGKMGKPSLNAHWGVVTFLSRLDADELTARVTEHNAQIADALKATPPDTTPVLMLAELYRQYGVYAKVLETLDRLEGQPGIEQAKDDAYREVSPYAYFLAHPSLIPPDSREMSSR